MKTTTETCPSAVSSSAPFLYYTPNNTCLNWRVRLPSFKLIVSISMGLMPPPPPLFCCVLARLFFFLFLFSLLQYDCIVIVRRFYRRYTYYHYYNKQFYRDKCIIMTGASVWGRRGCQTRMSCHCHLLQTDDNNILSREEPTDFMSLYSFIVIERILPPDLRCVSTLFVFKTSVSCDNFIFVIFMSLNF